MRIFLFLTNLDVGQNYYLEIMTSTEELGFRPVTGDYINMGDGLDEYFKDQSGTGIKYDDFYTQDFIVSKCVISEMDTLVCYCTYKS